MELVTGKRPIEPEFGENNNIVNWISSKSIMSIVDSRIPEVFKEDALKEGALSLSNMWRSSDLIPHIAQTQNIPAARRWIGRGRKETEKNWVEVEVYACNVREALFKEINWGFPDGGSHVALFLSFFIMEVQDSRVAQCVP
ncbi:hypothetical protein LWI29_030050 [Acer saccharum]|uniref:Uncharacterized protein n=1 Tax=Acer saccharum TaxID=4024 RepID=A0AA39TEE0_ACESA|nr:hypothetical protein LWI29_030050 [Acer saccharum]